MSQIHKNFQLKSAGLMINNDYPFCGASPDGVTSCDCCGIGVLEIKCPWLLRFDNMQVYLRKRTCPLKVVDDAEGEWHYELKTGHEYYYQVQMAMFVTKAEFCDFVVWNPIKYIRIRVYKDEPFWDTQYTTASIFFRKVLLPELLATYYTKKKQNGKIIFLSLDLVFDLLI